MSQLTDARLKEELYDAALEVNIDEVKNLLVQGADPDGDKGDEVPLLAACGGSRHASDEEKSKRLEIVKLLVEAGADINIVGNDFCTPILGAVGNCLDAVASYLIEKGAILDHSNIIDEFYKCFTEEEYGEEFEYNFIEECPRMTALGRAIEQNNLELIKQMMSKEKLTLSSINLVEGDTLALFYAVENGNVKIVKFLLSLEHIDVNQRNELGQTAWALAEKRSIKKALRAAGSTEALEADNFCSGLPPLFEACEDEEEERVKELIQSGADVNEIVNGKTPLFTLAETGNRTISNLLLDGGADPNFADNGISAFHWLVMYGQEDIALDLLHAGANIEGMGGNHDIHIFRTSPLSSAICSNLNKLSISMIEKGAKTIFDDGNSALQRAIFMQNSHFAEFLIEQNQDINHVNNDGETALQMVQSAKFKKLLKNAGATE